MSWNLHFKVKDVDAYVDLPYQTQTEFTLAMIDETDLDKRLELLKQDLDIRGFDEEDTKRIFDHVASLLRSPHLELSYL